MSMLVISLGMRICLVSSPYCRYSTPTEQAERQREQGDKPGVNFQTSSMTKTGFYATATERFSPLTSLMIMLHSYTAVYAVHMKAALLAMVLPVFYL